MVRTYPVFDIRHVNLHGITRCIHVLNLTVMISFLQVLRVNARIL